MQHWIIDRDSDPVSSWLEAMPAARMVPRAALPNARFEGPGVIWCRLRSGSPLMPFWQWSIALAFNLLSCSATSPMNPW